MYQAKLELVVARLLSLQRMAEVYQADNLTNAIRQFLSDWFKIPFLGVWKL